MKNLIFLIGILLAFVLGVLIDHGYSHELWKQVEIRSVLVLDNSLIKTNDSTWSTTVMVDTLKYGGIYIDSAILKKYGDSTCRCQ